MSEVVFDVFAAGGAAVLVLVVRRLWSGAGRRGTLFLLLWLGLEALAYFPLTPFPATRRVLGPLVVLTLLVGRLAARACVDAGAAARRLVRYGVRRGAGAGVLRPGRPRGVGRGVGGRAGGGVARRARRPRLVHRPLRIPILRGVPWDAYRPTPAPPSEDSPRKGDWIVRPDGRVGSQELDFDSPALREVERLTLDDAVPLRTVSCFYCGRTPLEHHEGPRMTVRIYEVIADYDP